MPAAIQLKFPPISRSKDWIGHSARGTDWVCWRLIVLGFKKILIMETGYADRGGDRIIGVEIRSLVETVKRQYNHQRQ